MNSKPDAQRPVNGNGTVTGVKGRKALRQDSGNSPDTLVWNDAWSARTNYRHLGRRLAESNDLYRNGDEGLGLIQVLPSGQTRSILCAADLTPLIADRLDVVVTKNGRRAGNMPTAQHLNAALKSETFLSCFRPVDRVVRDPYYGPDFSLAQPGYQDGGVGERVVYVGPAPEVANSTETIHQFLDAMDFESNADRTNAVGAALTVQLRNYWQGEKPLISITADKSFAGKGTVADFISGSGSKAELLYEDHDWPMQCQLQRQVKADPEIGLIQFDNIRLDSSGGRSKFIRSAFLESAVTSREIVLASPGAGEPIRLVNRYVVIITTNDGSLSPDLLNRALSIHLSPRGDVHSRKSPIGNPKYEFLPGNRGRIEAEQRGMIERWDEAGRPLDVTITHPMSGWAQTVGGILKVNGFADFLANQRARRTADDPIRRAIAILAAECPGKARPPREWADVAVELGLAKTLFSSADRDTDAGRERGIGLVLSRHLEETFEVEIEKHGERLRLHLRLQGGFRRWQTGKNPHTRYVFNVVEQEVLPLDECANRAGMAAT